MGIVELRERAQTEGTQPSPEESRNRLASYTHAEMIAITSFVYRLTFLKIERINNKVYSSLRIQELAAVC